MTLRGHLAWSKVSLKSSGPRKRGIELPPRFCQAAAVMPRQHAIRAAIHALCALAFWAPAWEALGTPANKAALDRHYDRFLAKELNRCTTCHLPSPNKA